MFDCDNDCNSQKHSENNERVMYKAVMKCKDGLCSHFDNTYFYHIGATQQSKCDPEILHFCSYGLHMCHAKDALKYGRAIYLTTGNDVVYLEVKANIADIVFPKFYVGECRTSKLQVIRELDFDDMLKIANEEVKK